MRKGFVLFVLFIATLSACQKTTNSSNQPTTYRVDFITDKVIAYDTGSSANMAFTVNYLGPIQETVTLSLENLPSGIYVDTSLNNVISGIPNFNGSVVLRNNGTAKTGTYSVTLVCTGSVTGRKSYTFHLKVLPPTMCTSGLLGIFSNCNGFCTISFTPPYADSVYADAAVANRMHFTNFIDSGLSVYIDLYCKANTFTMPLQQSGAHYFYGHGSFSPSASGSFAVQYTDSIFVDSIATWVVDQCGLSMVR